MRLSGPRAEEMIRRVVPELDGRELEPRRATLVRVVDPASHEVVDRGLLTWFPGPASYTGDDVAEFSGHGGGLTPRRVVEALRTAGARGAEPGEFTRRAYLNGKIDLVQAEAVDDLVRGASPRLHREALRQLDRHLSRRVAELRQAILALEAVLAHHIDFPDEDDPPVGIDEIARRARDLVGDLDHLAATGPEGERLRDGALVVLAGRPNVGKSSLYNALVGEERALVTEVPGTTRDALEADVSMDGYPVRLVDTAGVHDGAGRIERLGIEVARRFVDHADLVLYCAPAGTPVSDPDEGWLAELRAPVLRVRTMVDRAGVESGVDVDPEGSTVEVSAVTGQGLDALRAAVATRCFAGLRARDDDAPILTRERQTRAVRRAANEVRAFRRALGDGVPAEYASTHLKSAESALEEMVGLVDSDDVLDVVFRTFCVGK